MLLFCLLSTTRCNIVVSLESYSWKRKLSDVGKGIAPLDFVHLKPEQRQSFDEDGFPSRARCSGRVYGQASRSRRATVWRSLLKKPEIRTGRSITIWTCAQAYSEKKHSSLWSPILYRPAGRPVAQPQYSPAFAHLIYKRPECPKRHALDADGIAIFGFPVTWATMLCREWVSRSATV